VVKKLRVC